VDGVEYLTLVALARRLAEDISALSERASAIADEVVWQATRERGSAEAVAKELGVSLAAVRKAVQQRNRRLAKPLTEGTETDTTKRTSRPKGT
jgi:DNA-directed RNA polymerase specialized sigma24 family protein